jgi:hypothetical protein
MIHAGTATAVHDVSDGGLLVALAEMAMASGIGARLDAALEAIVPHAWWFGEDQARYIVTVPAADAGLVLAKMKGAGVPCARIGTTGGDAIAVAGEAPVSVDALKSAFEHWLPAYMSGKASQQLAVIPGWSEGPDPESRDSGFDAAHRPGMTMMNCGDVYTTRRTGTIAIDALNNNLMETVR